MMTVSVVEVKVLVFVEVVVKDEDGVEGEEVIKGVEVIDGVAAGDGADVIDGWLLGYSWERMLPKSSEFMFWEFAYFTAGVGVSTLGVGGVGEDWTMLSVYGAEERAIEMAAASWGVISDVGSSSKEMMVCLSLILNTLGREEVMMIAEKHVVRRVARMLKNMRFFLIF